MYSNSRLSTSSFKSTVYYLSIVCLSFLFSCKVQSEKEVNTSEVNTSQEVDNKLDFNKMSFSDRAEELIYIREYIKYKLPEVLIKKFPKEIESIQEQLILSGQNVTLKEAASQSLYFSNYNGLLLEFVKADKLSFKDVKWRLDNFDLYEKQEKAAYTKDKINNIVSGLQKATIVNIKDALIHNFTDDFKGYYTVDDVYQEKYPNCKIIYDLKKTDDPNIYKIFVTVDKDDENLESTIFEYNLQDNYYKHFDTAHPDDY